MKANKSTTFFESDVSMLFVWHTTLLMQLLFYLHVFVRLGNHAGYSYWLNWPQY